MMRKRFGTFFLILGLLLIAAALVLFVYNRVDANRAGEASYEILTHLEDDLPPLHPARDEMQNEEAMPDIVIDGTQYIGILELPSLGLRLPVAESWNYSQLRVSPCRYTGSWLTDDLVICAHNYPQHFSPIKWIQPGAEVWFTTADGAVLHYVVQTRETVRPTAISEMIDNDMNSESSADWDLTLFTCNTGGQTRCAVRCVRVIEE